jgi:hypothetical protein
MQSCCARAQALDTLRDGPGRAAALQDQNMCKQARVRPCFWRSFLGSWYGWLDPLCKHQQQHWKALARLCRSSLRLSRPSDRQAGSRPSCLQGTLGAAVRFIGLYECGVRCVWGREGLCARCLRSQGVASAGFGCCLRVPACGSSSGAFPGALPAPKE